MCPCVSVCVHVCRHAWTVTHMWRAETTSGVNPCFPPCMRQDLLLFTTAYTVLTGLWASEDSQHGSPGLAGVCCVFTVLRGSGGPNKSLHLQHKSRLIIPWAWFLSSPLYTGKVSRKRKGNSLNHESTRKNKFHERINETRTRREITTSSSAN